MSRVHTVAQGEHLARIAQEYGFNSPAPIWDDPANAELREKRGDPNVLLPGDRVVVPERVAGSESCPTEQRHRFRYEGARLALRLRLLGADGRPHAPGPCTLAIEGSAQQASIDANGVVEQTISPRDEHATLALDGEARATELSIGHLDPLETSTGQAARLDNLGYRVSDPGAPDALELRSAIEEFQCDEGGLDVDGLCGPLTSARLRDVHGC